ncbi:MAG: c-type cytochrome biogenesis protein CcmI [Alphaproteobacteria bacterium]|jgi:cytochrome c-type biogenesis protein CcmH|nr:c-type cytochrome biogenesis protein CcmI [Alphaproteobacteria bacterium]
MRWLPFVIMAVLAILVIAVPLVRKRKPPVSRADYDLQVYRDQLRELQEDVERGVVTKEQEASARLEIDRRILGVSETQYRRTGEMPKWQMAVALAILVPAVSVGLYWVLGAPGVDDQPFADRAPIIQEAPIPQEVLDFIAEQTAMLEINPEDGEGWMLLGRAHAFTGDFEQSVSAFRRAIALGLTDADTQMEMVEGLYNIAGGFITQEAQAAIDAALVADPTHPGARFYQGLALSQSERTQEAFDVWISLAADTPADAPWWPFLRQTLQEAADQLGLNLAELMPPPPEAAPQSPLEAMTAEEQMALIEGMVAQLAARLVEEPEDLEGWLRLSQSYRVLGRLDDAQQAVAKAVALAPNDPLVLIQQAGLMLAASEDGTVPPEAAAIFRRALELEPDSAEALFYSGVAYAEAEDPTAARAEWTKLMALLDPNGDAFAQVQLRMDALPGD